MKKLLLLVAFITASSWILPEIVMAQDGSFPLVLSKTTPEDKAILKKHKPHEPRQVPVANFLVKTKNNAFMLAIS